MNRLKQWAAENRFVARGGSALVLVLILSALYSLLSPLPGAKAPNPSLFYNPDSETFEAASDPVDAAAAFSERPLFSSTRRIKIPPATEPPPKAEPAPVAVGTMDGWSLLGIFNSGEAKGALVRHPNGRGYRLAVGERVDGWKLIEVDARSVRFESVRGGNQADLDMLLATVEVLPVPAVEAAGESESAPVPGSQEEPKAPDEPQETELMSFKGYYGGPRGEDE